MTLRCTVRVMAPGIDHAMNIDDEKDIELIARILRRYLNSLTAPPLPPEANKPQTLTESERAT